MRKITNRTGDIYIFRNESENMMIQKNGKEVGIYPNFKVSAKLDDNYLMELAMEFESDEMDFESDEMDFEILSDCVELKDSDKTVQLFERHNFIDGVKKIEYYTVDENKNIRSWIATKDPEHLTDDERINILNYCLSSYDKDEIVNYLDLFLHSEFIQETTK